MRYFIEHAGCNISKMFLDGVPSYMVWLGTSLKGGPYATPEQAKERAEEIGATIPRKSVMGE